MENTKLSGLKHSLGKHAVDSQVLPDEARFDNSGHSALSVVDDGKPTDFFPQELIAMVRS